MPEENESTQDSAGIASLRKQYDTKVAENAALQERLASFEAKERQSSVASVLKAKGLNEKAASLYAGDDVSEEAVGKWAAEYADVFGAQQGNDPASQNGQQDANAQQAQRVADAAFGAETTINNVPAGQPQVLGDPEEMLRFMQTAPYEELVKRGYMPNTNGTLFDTHGR